jgi:hypothetical protein
MVLGASRVITLVSECSGTSTECVAGVVGDDSWRSTARSGKDPEGLLSMGSGGLTLNATRSVDCARLLPAFCRPLADGACRYLDRNGRK